jgi:hypothetical protein
MRTTQTLRNSMKPLVEKTASAAMMSGFSVTMRENYSLISGMHGKMKRLAG